MDIDSDCELADLLHIVIDSQFNPYIFTYVSFVFF